MKLMSQNKFNFYKTPWHWKACRKPGKVTPKRFKNCHGEYRVGPVGSEQLNFRTSGTTLVPAALATNGQVISQYIENGL